MHAGLLDVLHDAADHHLLAVGQRIDVHLRGVVEEAVEPAVLLLDEPLAALDIAVAAALRPLLRRLCREPGRTTLLVTHDLLDVLALADRIAVIEGGRVVEVGETTQVLRAPRSAFAARLLGVNLVPGTASGEAVITADGVRVVGVGDVTDGAHAVAVFAPSAVSVFGQVPAGSPRNIWRSVVEELVPTAAGAVQVRARAQGVGIVAADITPAAVAELGLAPGGSVYLAVKAQEVAIHTRT